MAYLLDTDICAFLLRGKFGLNQKIEEVGVDNCFISEITILELVYGARMSTNYEKHIKEVSRVEFLFHLIPIKEVYDEFAKEKARLRSSGILIPDFDLLIGTTSVAKSLLMITNNVKHLERLQNIKIENWTKPEFNQFANQI